MPFPRWRGWSRQRRDRGRTRVSRFIAHVSPLPFHVCPLPIAHCPPSAFARRFRMECKWQQHLFSMRFCRCFIFVFSITALACGTQPKELPFIAFEFYHDNTWSTAFSIRFTQSDTVYIRQHFTSSSARLTIDTSARSSSSYLGILSHQEKTSLDSFIRQIDFSVYDTSYYDGSLHDGSTFRFYIKKDSLSKIVHIYGESAPAELLHFGQWITDIKRRLRLIEVDSMITFEHANDRLPPPVNVDMRKFTPPAF